MLCLAAVGDADRKQNKATMNKKSYANYKQPRSHLPRGHCDMKTPTHPSVMPNGNPRCHIRVSARRFFTGLFSSEFLHGFPYEFLHESLHEFLHVMFGVSRGE